MADAWRNDPVVGEATEAGDIKPRGTLPRPWETDPVVDEPFPTERPIPDDAPWHSLFTGAGRTQFPDAPELGTSGPDVSPSSNEGMTMTGAYATSADPKQIQDIAVKTLPGAKAKEDRYGNAMVRFRGKDYYVNKPGVSQADLFQLLSQAGAFAPAGRAAGAAKTVLGRAGAAIPGAGATSVALDLGAEALGSEQGVDYTRAAVSGATGGAAEFFSPLVGGFYRFVRGRPRLFDTATGRLTDKGRKAAEAAGFDPDQMGPDLERLFAQEATEATGGAGARLRGKEFGIPMTRGQATGDWKQLAQEEATRHGARGDRAGDIMRSFDAEQQAAMQGARGRVQSRLGGGETRVARPTQAGDIVGEGLESRAGAARNAVSRAYEEAAGVDASISAGGFKGLWRRAANSVQDYGIDRQLYPASARALNMLKKLESRTRRQTSKGRITSVSLKRLETERRKLGNLIDSAANPADRAAATRIKDEFDNWLDDAVDNALFAGDEKALETIKRARAENTRYRSLFGGSKSKDPASKAIQNIIAGDRTPEQVMNYIWGKGQLGAKDTSVDVLSRIKNIVGEGSEEWLALKEAGWLKLSKEIGDDTMSPRKYATRLNKTLENNRSVLETLYSSEEVGMMERFRDELMRTVTPEGAKNPSRTAYTASRLIREWVGRIGTMLTFSGHPVGGGIAFTAKRVPDVMGARAAREAVKPLVPPRLKAPLFASGSMAGGRLAVPAEEE